jgi:Amino acid permease
MKSYWGIISSPYSAANDLGIGDDGKGVEIDETRWICRRMVRAFGLRQLTFHIRNTYSPAFDLKPFTTTRPLHAFDDSTRTHHTSDYVIITTDITSCPLFHPSTMAPAVRDSLELASLASSSHSSPRVSQESSSSGAPSSRRLSFSDDDPLSSSVPGANGNSAPRHERSYSVSSAFDFAPTLFPLSSTAAGYTALGAPSAGDPGASGILNGGNLEKHKSLTYLNGLSLVIGLIIGSGIFSSPAQVDTNVGSPGASLLVWAVAGVLAWTGAASYAELGGAIPLNGGAQVYLSKIFGEWAGFLFTWCAVCVLKPGSSAMISIIFGEYTVRAIVGADASNVSNWINKGVALGGLILVTLLNCTSTKLGTRSADVFMFLKFVALLFVTVTGVVVAVTGLSWKGDASQDWKKHGWFDGTITDLSHWAVALYAGLWAFDGWDNVRFATPQTR